MNDLQSHFLHRSICGLQELAAGLQSDREIPAAAFRLLHTIKGTAQTFGLTSAAKIAHELEEILIPGNKELLLEGIEHLVHALSNPEITNTGDFSDRVGASTASKSQSNKTFISRIPLATYHQFSELEKKQLIAAAGEIFCLRIAFDLASFTWRFKELKETLDRIGDVIATLPDPVDSGVGFRIYLTATDKSFLNEICSEYSGELVHLSIAKNTPLYDVLSHTGSHIEELAAGCDKEVSFVVSTENLDLHADHLKLVFDILLHLVRNAIDHAFIERGALTIDLNAVGDGVRMIVSDDGRGIDAENLRTKAFERGLIGESFTGNSLDLIFLPGLSTGEVVSHTSGRGVGLDAVKTSVLDAGGKITVKSDPGIGTTFEVLLPFNV